MDGCIIFTSPKTFQEALFSNSCDCRHEILIVRSDTVLLSWTTITSILSRQLDHNNTSAASQSVVGAEQILPVFLS